MLLVLLALTLQINYEVTFIKDAARQIDSIAKWSAINKVESAMCVDKYHTQLTNDSIFTFIVEHFKPVHIIYADTLKVQWYREWDDIDLPCLHTHLKAFGAIDTTSELDRENSDKEKGEFQLVLLLNENYVIKDIFLYGLKQEEQMKPVPKKKPKKK